MAAAMVRMNPLLGGASDRAEYLSHDREHQAEPFAGERLTTFAVKSPREEGLVRSCREIVQVGN
jgi:hypothetical protein